MTRSTSITQIVLVAIVFLAIGIGGTLALLPAGTPASLGHRAVDATFPVTLQPDNDAQSVQIALVSQPAASIVAPSAGVLTESSCKPGTSIASGTAPFAISGIPVLVLSTAVPPWRDIRPRLRGADISAVQTELTRLGYSAGTSGVWDSRSETAIEALERHLGIPTKSGSLYLSDFSWQPQSVMTVLSCPGLLGTQVSAGSPVVTPAESVVGAGIVSVPQGVVPGTRMVQVGTLSLPVSASGAITDPELIAKLVASPSSATAVASLASTNPAKISAEYVLAHPPQSAQLPASAVHANETTACVFSATGKPITVRILGSELGRTIIEFGSGSPPTSVRLDVPPGGKCR